MDHEKVNWYIDLAILEAFDRIEDSRDVPPSEVANYLEKDWGLGDMWEEWWIASGEEYY